MGNRVYNFNPGPSTLPLEVLETVQEELLDYKGTGMSIMEISHRSPEYDEINNQAIDKNKRNIEVERMTLVKFTFYDDILVSWEEDKMTLSMSNSNKEGPSFVFTFINIFLNIVVITLNAAVLMSS